MVGYTFRVTPPCKRPRTYPAADLNVKNIAIVYGKELGD
jgi:hypothetical protein